jgi:hypothetical protein
VDVVLRQEVRDDASHACAPVLGRDLTLEVHLVTGDACVHAELGDLGIGGERIVDDLDEILRLVRHAVALPPHRHRETPGVAGGAVGYLTGVPPEQADVIVDALKVVAALLRDAGIPFALGGGMAAWARGGPPTEHDVDLVIRPRDVDTALAVLESAGLPTARPPEGWLVKTWVDDVLVDLIHCPLGLEIDDVLFDRCEVMSVAAVDMPVMNADDILVTKLLALTEHSLDFAAPLTYARSLREQVDWSDVARRVGESPFARTFLVLLDELGVVERAQATDRRTTALHARPRALRGSA